MTLLYRIIGCVTLRIITADMIGLMNQFRENEIVLLNIKKTDDLTVEISIRRKEYRKAQSILDRRGVEYCVISQTGIFNYLSFLVSRPVLVLSSIFIFILITYLPTRVLFIEVDGNHTIPTNLILEKAHACGIRFGSSRKLVRSERVKNQLISQIPELQWVGVNTDGCVATIHVTEICGQQNDEYKRSGVSSIVASRDGIILSYTVLQGTPICKPGQAVKEGETLVSGYTDCGISVQATQAKAEVLAQTTRSITVLSPNDPLQRVNLLSNKIDLGIRIGKKLINFWKGSGIPDTTCVKMYEEKHLVLPGGFVLPISLIIKHCHYYETVPTHSSDFAWLEDFATEYLENQMLSGQILRNKTHLKHDSNVVRFEGKYDCTEIIGKTKQEEIIENYGYDGKNR